MTLPPHGIPLDEFLDILKRAEKARKNGDKTLLKTLSERLEQIGYRLVEKDNELYVEMVNGRR